MALLANKREKSTDFGKTDSHIAPVVIPHDSGSGDDAVLGGFAAIDLGGGSLFPELSELSLPVTRSFGKVSAAFAGVFPTSEV